MAFRSGYRAITLDGDIYDPKGSVLGGYNESRRLIERALELADVKKQLAAAVKELETASGRAGHALEQGKRKQELMKKREELVHRKALLEQEEKANDEGELDVQAKRIVGEIESEAAAVEKLKADIKAQKGELAKLKSTLSAAEGGGQQIVQFSLV